MRTNTEDGLCYHSWGEYNGDKVEVDGGRLVIGRSLDSDVILRDSEVSSRHAQIIERNKVFWLQDMGSTNGTLVKDRTIIQERLSSGFEFKISKYRFSFAEAKDVMSLEDEATLEQIRRALHNGLIDELNLRQMTLAQMQDKSMRKRAAGVMDRLLKDKKRDIPPEFDLGEIKKAVLDAALGLGPLEDLLADKTVTEIMVNAPDKIFIEQSGKVKLAPSSFLGKREILTAIERIVSPIGRRIDESSPMVDARLTDGSRVNAIIPPLALDSPTLTIRKFPDKRMVIEDLVEYNSLTQPMAQFIELCAVHGQNMIISGGTGSGENDIAEYCFWIYSRW